MARFNPRTYDPANDSTLTVDEEIVARFEIGKVGDLTYCLCGCGETRDKEGFMQGHDARLKGILIRAHVTGTPVRFENEDPTDAYSIAEQHGTFWTDACKAAEHRWAEKAAERASNGRLAIGDAVVVKVGRWTYNGQIIAQDGDVYEVEYLTRSGERKTVNRNQQALAMDAEDAS